MLNNNMAYLNTAHDNNSPRVVVVGVLNPDLAWMDETQPLWKISLLRGLGVHEKKRIEANSVHQVVVIQKESW